MCKNYHFILSRVKFYITFSVITFIYLYSCTAPVRIDQKKLCPNYGFFKKSELQESTVRDQEDKYYKVMVIYSNRDRRNYEGKLPLRELTEASSITNRKDYDSLITNYKDICGKIYPNFNMIEYYKIRRERDINFYYKLIPENKILDIRDDDSDFYNAWFNKYVVPIYNNRFEGDEFEYKSKENEYKKIRDHKYVLTKSSVYIGEYNFNKECFKITFNREAFPNNIIYFKDYDGLNSYETTFFEENYCIPIPLDKAQQFREKRFYKETLFEIKKVVDYDIDSLRSRSSKPIIKFNGALVHRTFILSPIAFRYQDYETDEIIEDKFIVLK